jgi:predicted nucleotidyltransferase
VEAELIELADDLRKRPEVLGVALFGSCARGDNRPDSDIDVYVLVDEGSWRDVEVRGDRHFEFVYSSEEASRAFWKASADEFVQLWVDARILLDEHGKLNGFRREAEELRRNGRSVPDERTVRHRRFDAEDQVRAVRALMGSDPSTAALVLHRLVEALTELVFSLRAEWVPAPKNRLKRLRETMPTLGEAFDEFYGARDLDHKIEAALRVVARTFPPPSGL